MISRLDHNCLDNCLDETRDHDTTFKTKTKAVTLKTKTGKILSRDCLRQDSVWELPITARTYAHSDVSGGQLYQVNTTY